MGWFTIGSGRSYDSLSGTATIMGILSKQVLSYIVLNRKCRKCDIGQSTDTHDCRLNFVGTAKAMEPYAAVQLTKNNSILSSCNVEVGVMVADNDSSAFAAMRNSLGYEIVKQADKNHTSKGVVSALYKIQKSHKELNSESIKYLQKCFNYCISQNKGDCDSMATAIKNIPSHAFNMHRNCGSWCKYEEDPENYRHKVIGTGLKDEKFFDALQEIFDRLGDKADEFSSGASTNPNESINASIVSKAPKSRSYGTSTSAEARVAFAVLQRNEGEAHLCTLNSRMNCSPGKHTDTYGNKYDLKSRKRQISSQSTEFKKRRLFLKSNKMELKRKTELREGSTYETDSQLMKNLDEFLSIAEFSEKTEPLIVLFDLETNGFGRTADILQIAASYVDQEFCRYVKPTQPLKEEASQIHGLRLVNGQLELNGAAVESVSLAKAMIDFYTFLCSLEQKCILTAHNCRFDNSKLIVAIDKVFMMDRFKSVVTGFCDTLPIISKCNELKGKGVNKLEQLAATCNVDSQNAHNAVADVKILQSVLKHFKISEEKLRDSVITWDTIKEKEIEKEKKKAEKENIAVKLTYLKKLETCASLPMRKKLIKANISYEMMKLAYKENKFDGLCNLLTKGGVTKNKKIIRKISDFLNTIVQ